MASNYSSRTDIPTKTELQQKAAVPLRKLGKEYGVSHELVRQWFEKYDIPKIRAPREDKIQSPTEEDLLGMSSMSLQAIADKYNVSSSVVNRWYKDANIEKGRAQRQFFEISQEDLETKPIRLIAKEHGTSIQTIHRRINQMGVKKTPIAPQERIRQAAPPKEELEKSLDKTYSEIAREYNVYPKTVRIWFEKYGLDKLRQNYTVNIG